MTHIKALKEVKNLVKSITCYDYFGMSENSRGDIEKRAIKRFYTLLSPLTEQMIPNERKISGNIIDRSYDIEFNKAVKKMKSNRNKILRK